MEEANGLIEQLCLVAGMIMEDSTEAALVASATPGLEQRLALLSEASRDIQAMASAATAIARRYGVSRA